MADMKDKQNDIVVCRCEEVTLGEIREWIAKGYDTFDELKTSAAGRYGALARAGDAGRLSFGRSPR